MKNFNLSILFLFIINISLGQSTIIWDEPIRVADASYNYQHPRITLDRHNNPCIVWGNTNEGSAYFSKWDGFAFTTPIKVTPDTMEIFTASWAGPDIASFGDTIYIVCKQNPENTAPVWCFHSYDGGNTFSAPTAVDIFIEENTSRFPSVTVDKVGNPIVAFMKLNATFGDARYVVATSNDFGLTFNVDVLASNFSGGDVCDCCPISITSNNNYVAALYRDNLDNLRNAWAGISTDMGSTFTNGIQIDKTDWIINACPSSGPDGVIINDSLYSVFMSGAEGDTRVYFSSSSLSTFESSESMRLTPEFDELTTQNFPRISNSGNAVAIAWRQVVNTESQIVLSLIDDITTGITSDYDTVALLDFYGLDNTDVAMSPTQVHIIWQDNSNDAVMYRSGTYAEPVSVNNLRPNSTFSIYPNPAFKNINIILSSAISNGMLEFNLIDISGKKIFLNQLMYAPVLNIDIPDLADGIYFLEIKDNKGGMFTQSINILK